MGGAGRVFFALGWWHLRKGGLSHREDVDNRDGLLHHPLSFPLQSFGIFELSTLGPPFLPPSKSN